MRAWEFITEGKPRTVAPQNKRDWHGEIPDHHRAAAQATHKIRDGQGFDRIYHLNRVMMATACADGRDKHTAPNVNKSSWTDTFNTVHPYTEQEHNMLHQAMKAIPSDHETVVDYSRSEEVADTHKQSPVKAFKGYGR